MIILKINKGHSRWKGQCRRKRTGSWRLLKSLHMDEHRLCRGSAHTHILASKIITDACFCPIYIGASRYLSNRSKCLFRPRVEYTVYSSFPHTGFMTPLYFSSQLQAVVYKLKEKIRWDTWPAQCLYTSETSCAFLLVTIETYNYTWVHLPVRWFIMLLWM